MTQFSSTKLSASTTESSSTMPKASDRSMSTRDMLVKLPAVLMLALITLLVFLADCLLQEVSSNGLQESTDHFYLMEIVTVVVCMILPAIVLAFRRKGDKVSLSQLAAAKDPGSFVPRTGGKPQPVREARGGPQHQARVR